MSKIKLKLIKRSNALISLLLSLLGFGAACSLNSCEKNSVVEYGTPHADFILKGTVQSEQTSSAIPNIRVSMGYDTTFTDNAGNYQVIVDAFPTDQNFQVRFEDIDGAANGVYQPLDTIVDYTDPEFTGGSGTWYKGEIAKDLNVKLKPGE